jgi:hypothetical protein
MYMNRHALRAFNKTPVLSPYSLFDAEEVELEEEPLRKEQEDKAEDEDEDGHETGA